MEAGKVLTPKFRVSFPAIFTPKSYQGNDPKYGLQMIFDNDEDLDELNELIEETARAKFGAKVKLSKLKLPLRDGNDKENDEGETPSIYVDTTFANTSSKYAPSLVDEDLQEIISEEDFYAGCYARAVVNCYAYDVSGNKGVALGLQAIQKVADGERLGGGKVNAADVFSKVKTKKKTSKKKVVEQDEDEDDF
jgi:hypothetical protein